MLREEQEAGKFDPPPFGHFGEDRCGYGIVSLCDRSIERGRGGKATSAGRADDDIKVAAKVRGYKDEEGRGGTKKDGLGNRTRSRSSRYRGLVDIPFELVGKVASACAGAETLPSFFYGDMNGYEGKRDESRNT